MIIFWEGKTHAVVSVQVVPDTAFGSTLVEARTCRTSKEFDSDTAGTGTAMTHAAATRRKEIMFVAYIFGWVMQKTLGY